MSNGEARVVEPWLAKKESSANTLSIPMGIKWNSSEKNLLQHIIFLWHIVITCPFTIGFYVFCCVIIYGNVWFASFFCWSGVAPFG